MPNLTRHVWRCVVAGIVALLPLGGAVLAIWWLESSLSSWRDEDWFYFPGLGMLVTLLAIYAVGLVVTTFLGRWLWRCADRTIERLPLIGMLYQSLKEVLGYDTGRERFFQGVVLVAGVAGDELGLITGKTEELEGSVRTIVFVPGSPNPANGRLVLLEEQQLRRVDVRASEALRLLVAMGKAPLQPMGQVGQHG